MLDFTIIFDDEFYSATIPFEFQPQTFINNIQLYPNQNDTTTIVKISFDNQIELKDSNDSEVRVYFLQ